MIAFDGEPRPARVLVGGRSPAAFLRVASATEKYYSADGIRKIN